MTTTLKYNITIPDNVLYVYSSIEVSEKKDVVTIKTKYDPDYQGYRCATEGPPTKVLKINGVERSIISAIIVGPRLLEIIVELEGDTRLPDITNSFFSF